MKQSFFISLCNLTLLTYSYNQPQRQNIRYVILHYQYPVCFQKNTVYAPHILQVYLFRRHNNGETYPKRVALSLLNTLLYLLSLPSRCNIATSIRSSKKLVIKSKNLFHNTNLHKKSAWQNHALKTQLLLVFLRQKLHQISIYQRKLTFFTNVN